MEDMIEIMQVSLGVTAFQPVFYNSFQSDPPVRVKAWM